MPLPTSLQSEVHPTFHRFFGPLQPFLECARNQWSCPALPDDLWLQICVRRCLSLCQSGRDHLQFVADVLNTDLRRSTFFESLQSPRRLALLDELLALQLASIRRTQPPASDPFSSHASLDRFDLYAGDGHSIAAATHDPVHGDTKYPTGHLYTLDLRTLAMNHLTVSDQVERNKEHEIRALKRQTIDTLRQGAKKGRKVLLVWDRAGIDFRQWHHWKQQGGIYFLSRQKKNMRLQVVGEPGYDRADPVNLGILADELVATSAGVSVRRVTYCNPENGVTYHYLTNLPTTIAPGLVALLYQRRWGIEKKFDEFKNKLGETQAWASSPVAKTIAARFLCLTHNLLLTFGEKILRETGIANEAEHRRQKKTDRDRDTQAKQKGFAGVNPLEKMRHLFSQHSVKFIRWLKNHLDQPQPWREALAHLHAIYQTS